MNCHPECARCAMRSPTGACCGVYRKTPIDMILYCPNCGRQRENARTAAENLRQSEETGALIQRVRRLTAGVDVPRAPGAAPEDSYPDQTIMETTAERGNCLQATLAAILSRPLDTVPHFVAIYPQGDDWWDRLCGWLYDEGYLLRYPPVDHRNGELLPLCGLGGWSERGLPHIVVGDAATGQMVHDPHPSRAGLTSVGYTVLLYRRTDGVPGTFNDQLKEN